MKSKQKTLCDLVAEALWDFVSELEVDEGDFDVGLKVFDRLTYGQKVFR